MVLPVIAQYVAQHAPSIDIAAGQHDRRAIETDLLTGSLDAVIDVLLPHPQSVRSTRLSTDRYVVLCRRDHPRVGQRLDLDAYLAEEHVLVTSRQRGGGVEDAALVRLGAERRVRLRCVRYFAACRVVNQTDLLLTMPERYARLLNEMCGNRMLECPFDASIDTYLYWHANADADPANGWLRRQPGDIFDPVRADTTSHP
ncbi:LysR substrate-binding domain-containing protein [Burkholderia cepacia]|uniref:LysR substrate-binding domain-containing protein n=1 Tax=Burkholderia cepacia TaxID=292 RepID=UPI002ED8AAE5